jgi:RNA polymerase primary sigma factor
LTKPKPKPVNADADDIIMQAFLADMKSIPLLSIEQERDLLRQVKAGQDAAGVSALWPSIPLSVDSLCRQHIDSANKARQELASANIRLVATIASKYQGYGIDFLDLVQEGSIGLLEAIDRYDEQRGVKFSTFAGYWIQMRIQKALRNQQRTIRIPNNLCDIISQANAAKEQLLVELEREPSNDEVANYIGVNKDRLSAAYNATENPWSQISNNMHDDNWQLCSTLADNSIDVEGDALNSIDAERVRSLFSCLSPRQAEIINLRYGFVGTGAIPILREVASKLGVETSTVHAEERESLAKMRSYAEQQKWFE